MRTKSTDLQYVATRFRFLYSHKTSNKNQWLFPYYKQKIYHISLFLEDNIFTIKTFFMYDSMSIIWNDKISDTIAKTYL
jgi:hypothetical protein